MDPSTYEMPDLPPSQEEQRVAVYGDATHADQGPPNDTTPLPDPLPSGEPLYGPPEDDDTEPATPRKRAAKATKKSTPAKKSAPKKEAT
jgi:hypothetical protein